MKKKKIIICIAVIFCLSIGVTIFNRGNLKNAYFPNRDVQILEMMTSNDVYSSDKEYVVNGQDTYFLYQTVSERKFLSGIIRFGEVLQEDITLQIFYADAGAFFSEEESYFLTQEAGKDYVIFGLPDEDIKYVRIDIAEEEGYCFTIENIFVAEQTIGNYLGFAFSLHNLGVIVAVVAIIMLCCLVLYVGYKNRKVLQEKYYFLREKYLGQATVFLCYAIVIFMFLTVGLVIYMSSHSEYNAHPDEHVTKAAIDYYLEHWIPPDVRDSEIQDTFSVYGNTRLRELSPYYFVAGKIGIICKAIFHYEYYYRILNLLLYIIMVCIIAKKIFEEHWLAITGVITPQLWYIFSYATSDAWDYFWSFILIYEVISKKSLINQMLNNKAKKGKKILAYILFSGASAFIMMGKKNYYVVLLLLFIILLFRLIKKEGERKELFQKYVVILLIFGAILVARYSINISYYGLHEKEIYAVVKEERAQYEFKSSTPVDEQYESLHFKERGITLFAMLNKHKFGEMSYKSFIGVFGYMAYYCAEAFYSWMGILYIILFAWIYYLIIRKKQKIDVLEIIVVSSLFIVSIGLSIYNSWYLDFEPQGRYLLPMLISAGYLASRRDDIPIKSNVVYLTIILAIQISGCFAYYVYGIGVLVK